MEPLVVVSAVLGVVSAVLALAVMQSSRQVRDMARTLDRMLHPEEPSTWAVSVFPAAGASVQLEDGEIRALLSSICADPAPAVLLDHRPGLPEAERWTASVVDAHASQKIMMMSRRGVLPEATKGLYIEPWESFVAPTAEEAEAKAWQWVSQHHPAKVRIVR